MSQNLTAFLAMIAWSEGTSRIPDSDDGYRVIIGSTPEHPRLFQGYADHPRILVRLSGTLSSTAAGRYQLLERYFDAYKASLGLPDFSPVSQDAIAVRQITERGALPFIEQGNVAYAVHLCSNLWASLPGNDYAQHQQNLDNLIQAYTDAGGQLA